jgi:hypothetical protein
MKRFTKLKLQAEKLMKQLDCEKTRSKKLRLLGELLDVTGKLISEGQKNIRSKKKPRQSH